jgi:quercetin dioxygenase-like cupin family protein
LPLVHSAFDVRPIDGSSLALETRVVEAGGAARIGHEASDSLVYVDSGTGRIALVGHTSDLAARSACLVLAGEDATVEAREEMTLMVATVDGEVDLHAPLGPRELVTSLEAAGAQQATGARSFQILFGPHNGSARVTLFAGFIPPGRSPWHYHLYDEIVWVPDGPGRLHLVEGDEELAAGSAFRLRPRQVHIVENESADREMTIIGIFTPAGSPSAAYLTSDVAAEYRFAG